MKDFKIEISVLDNTIVMNHDSQRKELTFILNGNIESINYSEDMNVDVIVNELEKFTGGLDSIRLALKNLS